MKRFLIGAFLLWASLLFWSSSASAITVNGVNWNNYASYCGGSPAKVIECDRPDQGRYYCHLANYDNCSFGQTVYYTTSASPSCPVGETFNSDTLACEAPSCDSPNFIDPETGECVPPEEICFTTIEDMADQCVYIGEDDPNDQAPEGCIIDSVTGAEICLSEQPGCYVANGNTICPTPDMVCGEKNGTFSCVAPEEEGCGYFNGERVCFTPDGTKVEPDSPDHPDNGGNLDGNENNDVTDPRDPTEGGDPNNQPGESDTSATDAATEKTARDSLNKLRDIDKGISGVKSAVEQGFSSLIEEGNPAQVESIAQDIANMPISGLQDLEDGISLNPLDGDAADGVGNSVTGLVPQGTCSELGFNFNGHAFGLPCDKTQKIRDMLSWVLYFLTVWMLFDIVTSPVVRRA